MKINLILISILFFQASLFAQTIHVQDPKLEKEMEDSIYFYVEQEAEFIGGSVELQDWIKRFLVYPKEAAEKGLKGRAYLKFVVEKDGGITNVSVPRGVPDCPECDKEAIQLIKKMPNWKPAKNGGKIVRSCVHLPINFSLI